MRPFTYRTTQTKESATSRASHDALFLAGGTDLLPRMKLDLAQPDELIDIKKLDLPSGIEQRGEDLQIGALTTLEQIARSSAIRDRVAVLAEAAASAATPQIRHRATVGGNLLQRPRCWYYRHRAVDCWLSGGESCPAKDGRNESHAIIQQSPCVAVHPSDLAPALCALGAQVRLSSRGGRRTIPIEELFEPPTSDRRKETSLATDDLIESLHIDTAGIQSSTYCKAMNRKVWSFALVSVAAVRLTAGDCPIRIALGGVANTPVAFTGLPDDLDAILEAVLEEVEPLTRNRYKVAVLRALVERAVCDLREAG